MKIFTILFFIIFSTQIVKAQIDEALASQLQSVLDNSVSNMGNNGVSAHLIMPGGEIWDGTAGLGKDDLPIEDTTVFHGASTTKFNVAILMLLLAEEGLIDLDETWSNYISLDVDFDPMITIRQLLNHTSGIADYAETPSSGSEIVSDLNYFYTPQYILENIVSSTPDFPTGTNFQYSNSNYVLAGLIVEEVTGNPVHTELRNRIWNPLGMDHTYFGAHETYIEPSAGVWWDFGDGLTNYSNMPTTSMLSYIYGAGNIVTTPTDLAILLKSVLNGQLLSPQSLNEMMDFVPESYNSWTAGYGLGIHHVFGQTNDMVIGHDGYFSNLTSMFHSMNHGFTLVTMTNTQTQWFGIFNPMYELLSDYFATSVVEQLENNLDWTISPNPTQGQFNISCSREIDEIEIRDMLGRGVYHDAGTYTKSISLMMEIEGIYFVTIKSGQQTMTKKMLIEN